jgi:hypothetical protein
MRSRRILYGWLVGFTGILAISTIGLWIVTWRSGVRQSRDTAAFIGETKRIGEAQVRAYVDIEAADVTLRAMAVGVPEVPQIRIVARNTGQSPARNFLWHPTIQFINSRRPGIAVEQALNSNWREMNGISIPVGERHGDGAVLDATALQQATAGDNPASGTLVIRVKIDFEFEDVFDVKHAEEAYFAGVFGRTTMGFQVGPDGIQTRWEGKLGRLHRPSDWESATKPNKA